MVWAITIATFLGTVVAVLFGFFIFSHRERIRQALKEQRAERRISAQVGLELSTLDELIYEQAFTENASRHGARLITEKPRSPSDYVLVRLPGEERRSRARIVYCKALPGDAFAIGVQFSSVFHGWGTKGEPSGHAYRK